MNSRQSVIWLPTGFGTPAIISGLDGILPGPVDSGLGVDAGPEDEVEMLQYDLFPYFMLHLYLFSSIVVDAVKDVDINDEGVDVHDVFTELDVGVDIVHMGGWADLIVEDLEERGFRHRPEDPGEGAVDPDEEEAVEVL